MNTAEFLKALYGDLPTGYVEVRLIHRDKGAAFAPGGAGATQKFYRPLPLTEVNAAGLAGLHTKNAAGYNVYFQVAVEQHNRPGPHHKSDVLCLTALWFDVDKADETTEARLLRLPNRPDILVKSGKGYHGYYLLAEPVMVSADNLARLERTLDGIAFTVGGDRVCKNVNRILRLPGFLNTKAEYTVPPLCQVVDAYGNDGLKDFRHYEREYAVFGALPAPKVTRYIPPEAVDASLPNRVKNYLSGGVVEGRRNQELFICASFYRDAGRSVGQAENDLGARARADGLEDSEIQRTIASAYRRPVHYNLPSHLRTVMAAEDSTH